ncbi:MAG TPA: molybdopterin molybdenumtransferase MoeA, partial [Planctomycetota bacterium]|nr:molybdopterin molybdenumtransferase MoeA [Planctomycetota bacterium]
MAGKKSGTAGGGPLSAAEGLAAVLGTVTPVRSVTEALHYVVGRVLREDVMADRPLPLYDRAAMDGYAVRSAECAALPVRLTAVGEAPAGQPFTANGGRVTAGRCVRIMTGGVVPAGLDAIVPMELVKVDGTAVTIATDQVKPGQHVHRCGSDAQKGQVLLPAGHALRAVDIATLASVGVARPRVNRELQVALMATGTELVAVTKTPKPHQIRESNVTSLMAILAALPG